MGFSETFLYRKDGCFKESPFAEPIGHREGVVCFESDVGRATMWSGADADLETLRGLSLEDCYYGAGGYSIEPFVASGGGSTAAEVLSSLRVRNFGSEHIRSLDRTHIDSPGYHAGTSNDEIHSDPVGQGLFYKVGYDPDQDEELNEDPEARQAAMTSAETHQALRALVEGPLWYVLLHENAGESCHLVALFAVGRSATGSHLVGVASQQVCHNYCD